MDQQNTEIEKRLEKLEQEFSDLRKRLDDLASQTAVQGVPQNVKKPKGKLFLRVCIPILIVCLLTGGFFYYLASQKPSYAKAEIGDIVTFGRYEQNNSAVDGIEPIEWIVLDKQDGKILLLSRYLLYTSKPALTGAWAADIWENSSIRRSLNSDFLSAAFSPEEQNKICFSSIEEEGHASSERVFLLSIGEVESYFETEESREALPTVSCVAKSNSASSYMWWTRSVERKNVALRIYLSEKGETLFGGNNLQLGVRPALWLDITK